MRHRALRAAFRGAARTQPVPNRRDLRDAAADGEDRSEQRMVVRQILRRELPRRQRLAELLGPRFPGPLAPEVIGPQEAALQQVAAQRLGLRIGDVGGANLRHHDERALEERRIGQLDDEVLRLLRSREPDGGLGQLRQADRHVDVGTGEVDAPPAAVAVAILAKRDAAELPRAVEIFGNRRPHAESTAAAAAALRFTCRDQRKEDDK